MSAKQIRNCDMCGEDVTAARRAVELSVSTRSTAIQRSVHADLDVCSACKTLPTTVEELRKLARKLDWAEDGGFSRKVRRNPRD